MKAKNILIGFVIALLFLGGLWGGYAIYPRLHPCPEINTDTVYVYDTVEHHIKDTIPYYIIKHDSVIYHDTTFKDVDTAMILKNYYASWYYTRNWNDSIVDITLKDELSQNNFVSSDLSYKLLKPQTIVNNVVNNYSYSRYVTIGAGVTLKNLKGIDLEANYVTKTFYVGAGYNSSFGSLTLKGGMTLLRLK